MFTAIRKFRDQLKAGRLCLGTGITLSDPAVIEALADSVDFFWIDLEHSPTSLESLFAHLVAARAGGVAALVRVPGSETAWIKRVLDTGATGLIVPQVRSSEEVRQVVAACRYPPQGTRGYGPRRADNYGRAGGPDYLRRANEDLFVAVQIENVEAVNAIDAIVAVPGLDAIALGPYDLSASLGLFGQITHPRVREAMATVVKKARQAGRFVGTGLGPNDDHALMFAEMGVQWLQCGGDYGYMIVFVEQLFARIRKRVGE